MLNRRTLLASTAAAALARRTLAPRRPMAGALNALFDQFMKENLDQSPITVTSLGLDIGARAHQKSETDDGSLAGNTKAKALTASQLARLTAFNRASLSGQDAVNYDVVMYGLKNTDASDRRYAYGPANAGEPYILSQLTGNYCNTPAVLDTQHSIETKADADAYLARLEGFGHPDGPGNRSGAP